MVFQTHWMETQKLLVFCQDIFAPVFDLVNDFIGYLDVVWPDKNRQMSIKVAKIWCMILTPLQKLPKNVGDLGKLIVAKGFKDLPKVQLIAQSGHTA